MNTINNTIVFSITKQNATTFFDHKEVNIPSKYTKDYSCIKPGLGLYKFIVNEELISSAPNKYIRKALCDIKDNPKSNYININGHGLPYVETNTYDQYLMTFSPYLEKKMEIVLWASYANWKNDLGIEPEKLTIKTTCVCEADNTTGKEKCIDAVAELTKIEWKIPSDNKFCDMAIQSAYYFGANSIAAAEEYFLGRDNLDFYKISEPENCIGWKRFSELESEAEKLNVIYMLYDENRGHIYVGRADKFKQRLMQHRDKVNCPNDPIPEFTHYRYTQLEDQYYKYSYLIEDAAIHDIAWIFPMSNSNHFHNSLQEEINFGNINVPTGGIKMVNRVECQPQIINTDIFNSK